jgi:hypothetical protein
MKDTASEMVFKQLEIFLSKSESERFQISDDLNMFGRKVLESSIRQEQSGITEIDLKIEVFKRCYNDFYSPDEFSRIILSMRNYLQKEQIITLYSIISGFKPNYFWDVDISGLDETSACRLIIERVFSLGEVHEMNKLINFYGREKVLDVLCNLSYLDPKTLNFVSKLFNKPLKSFRCHRLKQSRSQYWNL